jgi:hypothetical protein
MIVKLALFTGCAVLAFGAVVLDLAADERPGNANEMRVIVKSVDVEKNTLVGRPARDGETADRTFDVAKDARIVIENRDIKLADLKAGSLVTLKRSGPDGAVVGIQVVAIGRGERKPETATRDGERKPGTAPRDGERKPEGGPRDGERKPEGGPRDGERKPEGGPRDGERKPGGDEKQ